MNFNLAAIVGFIGIVVGLFFAFSLPGYLMIAPVDSWALAHYELLAIIIILAMSGLVSIYMAVLALLET